MKKYFTLFVVCLLFFWMMACGGETGNVMIQDSASDLYTESEIESAIEVAKTYFERHFNGCTLTSISYAGDEYSQDFIDFAERNDADEVIVLISSFDVGPTGGDGSLNPNSTYTGWNWILVCDEGGKWRHVDHGY